MNVAQSKLERFSFMGLPVFTEDEVAAHCTEGDCWISAHGRVYNATPIMHDHPGGSFALRRNAGRECSRDFDFHSVAGRRQWADYQIGWLDSASKAGLLKVAIWALKKRRDTD